MSFKLLKVDLIMVPYHLYVNCYHKILGPFWNILNHGTNFVVTPLLWHPGPLPCRKHALGVWHHYKMSTILRAQCRNSGLPFGLNGYS